MKKYKQLICDGETGDCFRACMATILQIPIEELPNTHDDRWFPTWRQLLFSIGLELNYTQACWIEGFWIASVPSKNFPGKTHAIVMKGSKVFFDPSTLKRYKTNREMLGTNLVSGGFIILLNDITKIRECSAN